MNSKSHSAFAFEKTNFILLLSGVGILILGYILMSGGGTDDPNVFSREIFSKRRITVAPIVVSIGYIFIGYAIMWKPGRKKNESAMKG